MPIAPPRRARRRPAVLLGLSAILAAMLALSLAGPALAGTGSPGGGTPTAWPSTWNPYRTSSGTPVIDVEGESGVGAVYDISSDASINSSVNLATDGVNAFFRVRLLGNPVDVSKGGFDNAAWLVQIATEDTPGTWTTKAVVGVDGKPVGSAAAPDKVYVASAPGTTVTPQYTFDTTGTPFNPTNAVGTAARVTGDGLGQYYLDFQVPFSAITAISGNVITTSTPVRLFFGSSAAANLATINKDYMTGSSVSFDNLDTVTLTPPVLTLTQAKSLVSGTNPPKAGAATVYDIALTARNTGGTDLFNGSVTFTIPTGITIVSTTAASGSISQVGQLVTWTLPTTLEGGATATGATVRVSITPTTAQVGTSVTLAPAAAGSGSSGFATITATGTAQTTGAITAGDTSTGVVCTPSPVAYGSTASCTVTVTDPTADPIQPTGTVTLTPVGGTVGSCTLAGATAGTSTCTVTFTPTSAGEGSLDAAYGGDTKHLASSGSAAISVSRAELEITIADASRDYGAANPSFSIQGYAGFVGSDDATDLTGTAVLTTSATTGSHAGPYAITGSGLSSPNYDITWVSGTLTVDPIALTATVEDATKRYGDPNPAFSFTFSGFIPGDSVASLGGTASFSTGATAASPAGPYAVSGSGLTSTDYVITFEPGTLTVEKAPLTVTTKDATRAYGQPNPSFTAKVEGFVNGDDEEDLGGTLSFSTAATSASPVGDYPVTPSGLTSDDYDITFIDGTLTIEQAKPTITPGTPPTLTYGDPLPGDPTGGDSADVPGTFSCDPGPGTVLHAGNHTLHCTFTPDDPGYETVEYDITVTVERAPLTVAAKDATRTYGQANPSFTAKVEGFVNGDDETDLGGTLDFDTTSGSSLPGTYPITPTGLTSDDYEITFIDGTLTIEPGTPVITPGTPPTLTYGDPLPGDPTGGDSADVPGTFSCDPGPGEVLHAGDHTLHCTFTPDDPGYETVEYDITVTVEKAPLTVTAKDKSRAFGAPDPSFTAKIEGFVNGDDKDDLGGTLDFTTSATSASPVGLYPITPSGLTSDDYAITFEDGTLTVTGGLLPTITHGTPPTLTYGDPLPSDPTGGDSADIPGTFSCDPGPGTVLHAGDRTLRCTFTPDDTATWSPVEYDITVTVKKAPLTVTAKDKTRAFGQSNPTFTVAYDGFVNGDDKDDLGGTLSFDTTADGSSHPGDHPITPSGLTSDDYAISFLDGMLTITKAAQSITFGPLSDMDLADSPITLQASSDRGLPVTFTASGACSVAGDQLTLTGTGTCTVTAHQPGDQDHEAAEDVQRTFEVTSSEDPGIATLDLQMRVREKDFPPVPGAILHFSYVVPNNGALGVPGPISIADGKLGTFTCSDLATVGDQDQVLDPGESVVCTVAYAVTAEDVRRGVVRSTATAHSSLVSSGPASVVVRQRTLIRAFLDVSGSMDRRLPGLVARFDRRLNGWQRTSPYAKLWLTMFSQTQLRTPIAGARVKDVSNLASSAIATGGGTNLYDTLGRAITSLADKAPQAAVRFVILTDGADTVSRTWTKSTLAALIARMQQERGWTFVYLGESLEPLQREVARIAAGGRVRVAPAGRDAGPTAPTGNSQPADPPAGDGAPAGGTGEAPAPSPEPAAVPTQDPAPAPEPAPDPAP